MTYNTLCFQPSFLQISNSSSFPSIFIFLLFNPSLFLLRLFIDHFLLVLLSPYFPTLPSPLLAFFFLISQHYSSCVASRFLLFQLLTLFFFFLFFFNMHSSVYISFSLLYFSYISLPDSFPFYSFPNPSFHFLSSPSTFYLLLSTLPFFVTFFVSPPLRIVFFPPAHFLLLPLFPSPFLSLLNFPVSLPSPSSFFSLPIIRLPQFSCHSNIMLSTFQLTSVPPTGSSVSSF